MFRWKKDKDKEKDKDDKKKKEKKDRKDRKSTIEKESLTQDELRRLDEVRRSFTSSRSSKGDDNSEKQSNSSDYSLSSAHDSSPSGSSLTNVESSPSRKPPPIPKKPTLLVKPNQMSGNVETTPSPQGSTFSMASLHLGTANLTNEMMAFMDQMNHPGAIVDSTLIQSPAKPSVPPTPPSQVPPGEQGGYGIRWKSYTSNFRLPPVTYLPAPPVRALTIRRQVTGDFGFALRRAAVLDRHSPEIEARHTVVFAEPSSLGKTNDTGLLPGDRLLEVNNVSVENKPREEIIELILSSKDVVTLKVQTVPELRELNKRCQESGDTIDADRTGSFSPTSTKFKTVAKSEEEMEVEKSWLSKDMMWIMHKGGFSAAHLVKTGPAPQEGKLFVKMEFTQDVIEVNEEDVEKANPPYFDFLENVAHLRHVNECSVLHTLRQRYSSQLIYTYAGSNLLVLNPVQPLAAYSEKVFILFDSEAIFVFFCSLILVLCVGDEDVEELQRGGYASPHLCCWPVYPQQPSSDTQRSVYRVTRTQWKWKDHRLTTFAALFWSCGWFTQTSSHRGKAECSLHITGSLWKLSYCDEFQCHPLHTALLN